MRRCIIGLLVVVLAALTGCGNDSDSDTNSEPDQPASPTAATLSPVLIHLQQDYEALRSAQQTITDIWDGLATGQQVQCGEYPAVLNPRDISDEGDSSFTELADHLRRAAVETERAVNLWQAECLNPRANPSSDVIDQGRLASRAAGDALRAAETLLDSIQGRDQDTE
ncbi:MAG: hypothetical protein JXQ72_00940 [Anaerolineae bacterium]|nr:hypothetical protein [Anaerolineae bacterium]